ncbi:hypothetical protein ABID30_002931 [Enterococcus rotai]|uniref:RepB family plasmid replication initiator protein n=1 Tax=Enterococcus rotai TaxID=118060 RepID=UPI00339B570F
MTKTLFDVNYELFKIQIMNMTEDSKKLFDLILNKIDVEKFYDDNVVKLSKIEVFTKLRIDGSDCETLSKVISDLMTEHVFPFKNTPDSKYTNGTRSMLSHISYSSDGKDIDVHFIENVKPFLITFKNQNYLDQ